MSETDPFVTGFIVLLSSLLQGMSTAAVAQRVKFRGFCGESPGIVVVGGGNRRRNLDCK